MEISPLETFLQVAETESFTRAAESLHLDQSKITARIQMLEKTLRSDPPLPGIPVYLVLPKRKRGSGGMETLTNHLLHFFNRTK